MHLFPCLKPNSLLPSPIHLTSVAVASLFFILTGHVFHVTNSAAISSTTGTSVSIATATATTVSESSSSSSWSTDGSSTSSDITSTTEWSGWSWSFELSDWDEFRLMIAIYMPIILLFILGFLILSVAIAFTCVRCRGCPFYNQSPKQIIHSTPLQSTEVQGGIPGTISLETKEVEKVNQLEL